MCRCDWGAHLQKRRFLAAGILLIYVIAGCAADSTTLNSERIARKFGSYGIEVIESTNNNRVTSLYSEDPAGPTSRTFAVVELPTRIDTSGDDMYKEYAGGKVSSFWEVSSQVAANIPRDPRIFSICHSAATVKR